MNRKDTFTSLILAGGFGTRLAEVTDQRLPKPLVQIGNRAIIEHAVRPFKDESDRIILILSHKAQMIMDHFAVDPKLEYRVQDSPSGVIDEVQKTIIEKQVDGNVAIVDGDSIRHGLDVSKLFTFHRDNRSYVTLAATSAPLLNPKDYHGVIPDPATQRVLKIHEPNDDFENPFPLMATAILSPSAVETFLKIEDVKGSWLVFLSALANSGEVFANIQPVKYFNINTPEIFHEANLYMRQRD